LNIYKNSFVSLVESLAAIGACLCYPIMLGRPLLVEFGQSLSIGFLV